MKQFSIFADFLLQRRKYLIKKYGVLKKEINLLFPLLIRISIILLLLCFAYTSQAQALKATGGTGLYKDRIWWMNFQGFTVPYGGTTTRDFAIGTGTVHVTISHVNFTGQAYDNFLLSSIKLEGYNSSYGYDGLDELYNIGGTETNNTLYYALRPDNGGSTGSPYLTATFKITAYVTCASGATLPLSLVFASAETDDWLDASNFEYAQCTTNGSTWQLLEKAVQSNDTYRQITFSNNNLTAKMTMGSSNTTGMANVALLYTTKTAASAASPLVVDSKLLCGGRSAIAVGFILDQDGGDAATSYGNAIHCFQPVISGGNPVGTIGTTFTNYLSTGTNGGSTVIDPGTLTTPTDLYLGAIAPDNDATILHSTNCDADNNTGTNDEDAVSNIVWSLGKSSYSLTNIPVHNSMASSATLTGWVDFNGNGTFEATEAASATVATGQTTASLSWTGITTAPTTIAHRAMRLRITTDAMNTSNATSTVALGEVEDHWISFSGDPCDAVASGNIDSDGDGKSNNCDLDDDNDGILDTDENPCTLAKTGTWTTSGTSASGTAGSVGVTFNVTNAVNTAISYTPTGTFNTTNFWSDATLAGANSLEYLYTWDLTPEATSMNNAADDAGTATLTITFSKPVLNPIIHIDRLGGTSIIGSNYYSNSSEFTLITPGIIMNKLAGNSQLIVNENKFYRQPNVYLGTTNPGAEANITTGTAAGSIQFIGNVSTLTFTVSGVGPEALGQDGLEMIFQVCPVVDTDNDGAPNYLDLDSDGDGCSDVNEAYSSVTADGGDDGYYGTSPVAVNADGTVVGAAYPGTNSAVVDGSYVASVCAVTNCFVDNIYKNNTFTTATTGAYWPLDGNANDATGNGYNKVGGTGPASYSSTTAISGQAAYFNGAGVQYSTGVAGTFMTTLINKLSWGAWIKPDQVSGGGNQIIFDEGGSSNGITVFLNDAGMLRISVIEGGIGLTIPGFPFPTDGLFHHISFTYDGSNNGRLVWALDGIILGSTEFQDIDDITAHSDGGGLGAIFGTGSAAQGIHTAATFVSYKGYMDDVYYTRSLVNYGNVLQYVQCNGYSNLVGLTCPSPAFMVQGATSDWVSLNLATGVSSALTTDNLSASVNAIGYNEIDGIFYGVGDIGGVNYITATKVTASGANFVYNTTYVSEIPAFEGLNLIVGDVYNGKLYVREQTSNTVYVIDVDPASATYLRLINTLTLTGTAVNIADWAFTNKGRLYAVTSTGLLYQFNLTTLTQTSLGAIGVPSVNYGATYFDNNDYLYAYNNTAGTIYRINVNGPSYTGVVFATGNSGLTGNDGARCANAPVNLDFGDAPDASTATAGDGIAAGNYRTMLSDNGPRHVTNPATNDLYLGSNVTNENDGKPSTAANLDTDDGITITTIDNFKGTFNFTIPVHNSTTSTAYLYAWVDINSNGRFDGNEFATATVAPGATSVAITLNFPLASIWTPGSVWNTQIYGRFRLTTDVLVNTNAATTTAEDTRSFGAASNGEVEDYLFTVNLKNYWYGTNTNDWGTASNWTAGSVPNQITNEDVEFATTSNWTSAAIKDLRLDMDRTIGNLINATNLATIIPAGKALIINEKVIGSETNSDKLKIEAATDGTTANGSFIVKNGCGTTVMGTVQMYAKGYKQATPYSWTDIINGSPTYNTVFSGYYHWQFFGIPVSRIVANPTFYGSYLRKYHEDMNGTTTLSNGTTIPSYYKKWETLTNSSILEAFSGYEITQDAQKIIIMKGALTLCDKTLTLTHKAPAVAGSTDTNEYNSRYGLGQNVFGNSFTAALPVNNIEFPADGSVEKTVYLYNTASFGVWGSQAVAGTQTGVNAGMYISIPVETAPVMGYSNIPSMNGFLLRHIGNDDNDRQVTLKYVNLKKNTQPQTVPRQKVNGNALASNALSYLEIELNSASTKDKLWMFSQEGTSDSFDNGWDGHKFFGVPTAYIYAPTLDGNMQVSTTNNLIGSYIGFVANADTEYTLKVKKTNLDNSYSNLFLVDLVTNNFIPLDKDEVTYQFTSSNKGTGMNRFQIRSIVTSNNENSTDHLLNVKVIDGYILATNNTPYRGTIQVFDVTGKMLINQNLYPLNNLQLSEKLERGAYLVKFNAGSQQTISKVIIR